MPLQIATRSHVVSQRDLRLDAMSVKPAFVQIVGSRP